MTTFLTMVVLRKSRCLIVKMIFDRLEQEVVTRTFSQSPLKVLLLPLPLNCAMLNWLRLNLCHFHSMAIENRLRRSMLHWDREVQEKMVEGRVQLMMCLMEDSIAFESMVLRKKHASSYSCSLRHWHSCWDNDQDMKSRNNCWDCKLLVIDFGDIDSNDGVV